MLLNERGDDEITARAIVYQGPCRDELFAYQQHDQQDESGV